jgi:mono/diheme cytochrome c family protein
MKLHSVQMRRERGRYCLGVALAVFVAGAWMSSTRPLVASPVRSSPPFQEASSSAAVSVLDGVFTSDQAMRGQQRFQIVCSSCHTLAEHTGRRFAERWGGSSVGDLFDVMSNTMPDGNPGSLKPEDYASLIAFFLKETGYPEGKQELPATSAALMKVRIEPLEQ